MRKDHKKIKILRDHLLGLKMELELISNDLKIIGNDLAYLEKIERDLVCNTTLLKKEKVIAIASQYKKTQVELESVRKSLNNYYKAQRGLGARFDRKTKTYNSVFAAYEKKRKILEESRVILLFDPKKRKNKKNERQRKPT